jgi:hypothetical protein
MLSTSSLISDDQEATQTRHGELERLEGTEELNSKEFEILPDSKDCSFSRFESCSIVDWSS